MLLIHDFAESVTTDIAEHDKKDKDEIEEHDVIQQLVGGSLVTSRGLEIGNLFKHIEQPWIDFTKGNDINFLIAN